MFFLFVCLFYCSIAIKQVSVSISSGFNICKSTLSRKKNQLRLHLKHFFFIVNEISRSKPNVWNLWINNMFKFCIWQFLRHANFEPNFLVFWSVENYLQLIDEYNFISFCTCTKWPIRPNHDPNVALLPNRI